MPYGIRKQDESAHADLMAYDVAYSTEGSKFHVEKRYSNEQHYLRIPACRKN